MRSALEKAPGLLSLGLGFCGVAIAFVATMCGIGGGLFCVPLLHFGVGLPLRRSVATGLCLVFVNAVASTITEVTREQPRLDVVIIVLATIAALLGAQLGYRVSRKISLRGLRFVFAIVLASAGARILLAGSAGAELLGAGESHSFTALAVAAVAGLGGGFLAPLLGIGGGLVIVPTLFLGVPGLGFGGARACSMAVAIATGARSLRLYAREGQVDWARGVPLGLGAILGAYLGVSVVHSPGWIERARLFLGLCLVFVSLRFVWALLRERQA